MEVLVVQQEWTRVTGVEKARAVRRSGKFVEKGATNGLTDSLRIAS